MSKALRLSGTFTCLFLPKISEWISSAVIDSSLSMVVFMTKKRLCFYRRLYMYPENEFHHGRLLQHVPIKVNY